MRDSSPDDVETTAKIANADNRRAKSPPICGRGRSRSKERKPHKHHGQQQNTSHKQFVDDGGYEPVGKERSDQAAASSSSSNRREAIQPLNKMSQMAAATVETKTSFIGSKFSKNSNNKQILPPRKAFTALPEPPEVNRDTKPTVFDHTAGALINDQLQQQMPKQTNGDEAGGYEPVGLERRRKDYEDMDKSIPPEYAKVDKSKKVEVKSHEINNGLPDEKGKHDKAEKEEEQEKKLKEKLEKEQKEKLEKEIKLKEKMEKEQKVAEEKERKLKERLEKEEKKAKEKFEKEQREAEEKERKLKERLEKEQKDKLEKEKKLKEKLEKEQKDKEEKERKLKEKLEKEQKEKLEKEQKQNEEKEKKLKEKQEKEQREKLEKEKKQKDKEEKERKMKEKLEREKFEKEQKDKEEKERKLKEKLDKEQKDKEEKELKLKEKLDNEEKEKKSKEKKEFNFTAKPFGKQVKEDYEKNHSKAQETVFQQDPALVDQVTVNTTPIVLQDFPSTSSLEEEELNFSGSDQDLQDQSFEQPHDEFDELFNATRQPLNNDGHFDDQFFDNEQEHLAIVHGDRDGSSKQLSEKERKQMEKSLKTQKEKEEKERKKKEKEEKKKEEKEKKLKAKQDKELEKMNKRKLKEEMEHQEQSDKANKVKGLLELAKQKNLEQKQKEAFEQSGITEVEGDQIMLAVPTTNGHENHSIALNDDEETLAIQNTRSSEPFVEDISQHVMNDQVDDDFEEQFLSTKNEVDCETDSGIPGRSRKDQSSKNKG